MAIRRNHNFHLEPTCHFNKESVFNASDNMLTARFSYGNKLISAFKHPSKLGHLCTIYTEFIYNTCIITENEYNTDQHDICYIFIMKVNEHIYVCTKDISSNIKWTKIPNLKL